MNNGRHKKVDYCVLNTQKSDLTSIYKLFEEAIAYQKKNNYPIWKDRDKTVLKKDIDDKKQFKILRANELACIFSICHTDKIVWREREIGNAVYLYNIAVSSSYKGKKLFKVVLDWAEEHASRNGLTRIRMNTWANNPPLISYYGSFGFKVVEYWTTPQTPELPIQRRGNQIALLEKCIL